MMQAPSRLPAPVRMGTVLGFLALMAGCSDGDSAPPPTAAGAGSSVAAPSHGSAHPSMSPSGTGTGGQAVRLPGSHVHGLARDPGNGTLLVAAHDGLYHYDGATPTRVGPVIDLMGFTVAGPGHYYASGHPGTATALPQPVGLIESRDGGRTWTVLSRAGQSDFHTLTTTRRDVIGFDGTLRATTDGRTWTEGSLDVEPRTLAGSRQDRTILATTQEALLRSTDGGTSWREVEGAPWLLMAAFGDGPAVAGLTPDGQVFVSDDAGQTWRETQLLAPSAQALHVSGAGEKLEILVASGSGVLASVGGRPFEALRSGSQS